MRRNCTLCLLLLALLFFPSPPAAGETVHIAADDPFWRAERGVLKATPDALTIVVNGETPIMLDMNGIATLTFSYETDGWFTLTWDSIVDQPRNFIDAFVQTAQLQKGKGTLTIDFRRNRQWAENTVPYLKVRGTGTLTIGDISARIVDNPGDYLWQKRAAFIMMPEGIKPYSVIFLTPVYADEKNNLYFADVLGMLLIAASLAITALSFKYRHIPARRIVIKLSLFTMAIFSIHFLIRFAPEIHATPFLPQEEKISRNMYDRELGELIKTARQKIPPRSSVFLDSGESAYTNRIICFYLMPRPCTYERTPGSDAVVGYYPHSAPPPGFSKVSTLNSNIYIALRQ